MAKLFGKNWTKNDFRNHFGHPTQVAGLKPYELNSGKARGVRAIDVVTGGGLSFTVVPDRGMDISWSRYNENPLGYMTANGVSSPAFFHEDGAAGFLKNFFAGLMTTCGLTHFGAPSTDDGVDLGLHGVVNNIPAEDISLYQEWEGDEFVMKVRGKVTQSSFFGEDLTLTREIRTVMGENRIHISDSIENCGVRTQPFMLLYHIQFGYPFVSEYTELLCPKGKITPRDEHAGKGMDAFDRFQVPTEGYREQCFYHDHTTDEKGNAYACLFNPELGTNGLGAFVQYNKSQLPYFVEWKQMGQQEYVVGLEPGTWYAEGRAEARKQGELQFIEPGETKKVDLTIGVVGTREELLSL